MKTDYNWSDELKKYETSKKNMQFEIPKKPEVITHKIIKQNDLIYNPILQSYNNKQFEDKLKQCEKNTIINTISKNADDQLRMEQSYNIINLHDRLKGMEGHPDYPKEKLQRIKKNLETSLVDYNILSSIGLDKHNYLKPELRPQPNQDVININA
jgi:hypothetical protein